MKLDASGEMKDEENMVMCEKSDIGEGKDEEKRKVAKRKPL